MPATEQTWRDLKLLHVVFGFSSLLMLLTSIWLFAKDHNREWKVYQRGFRGIEWKLTQWQKETEEARLASAGLDQLERQLTLVRGSAPALGVYEEFKKLLVQDAQARGVPVPDLKELDARYRALADAAQDLARAQSAHDKSARALADARSKVQQLRGTTPPDAAAVEQAEQQLRKLELEEKRSAEALEQTLAQGQALRRQFFRGTAGVPGIDTLLRASKFRESELVSQRKFMAADYDAARARLDILVRDGAPSSEQAAVQKEIDRVKKQLDQLTLERDRATVLRTRLQQLVEQMREEETKLTAQLADSRAELKRLEEIVAEKEARLIKKNLLPGKRLLELPILDAFNSPLKIDNLWTEGLTLVNGSFGQVRRFDRCTTCHKGIDKTAAGTADQPAYCPEQELEFLLDTPSETVSEDRFTLQDVFGIGLANEGLIDPMDVTVSFVAANSPAARARNAHAQPGDLGPTGIRTGDVVVAVNGDRVRSLAEARQFLLNKRNFGKAIRVTIRRGLPEPFTSHPRLDLYVSSTSPHPLSVFACTSCHEGQGTATAFEFASHSPNTLRQAEDWSRKYGWFNNPHWIYPMYPQRFAESTCLRCHHDVVELEASQRFPDPPAPKLVEGFRLVQDYGCYACHEIHGYAGADRRVGPDLRLEPNYSSAAAAIKADPQFKTLDSDMRGAIETLIQQPHRDDLRHQVRAMLTKQSASGDAPWQAETLKMADVLQDEEIPGTLRKVGPSLRYVASKLDLAFMVDWIREPAHFRPSTKMPRFFGLWDHLKSEPESLKVAQRYEPLEILGLATYLKDKSQPFEYLPRESVDLPASAERGKQLFEVRGCLACHQHEDFPAAKSTHGPNLTHLGDKFQGRSPSEARDWLYSWLKQPTHYSPRTRMPNLYLDPITDDSGKTSDPAADIAEYLLSSSRGWRPAQESLAALHPDEKALDELLFEHLRTAFTEDEVREYLRTGIPENIKVPAGSAESEIVGRADLNAKLRYLGHKTLFKYGCYACHDIPGFEAAKPIGTALADWGRKESAKIAFEHINEYLGIGHAAGNGHHAATAPSEGHDESAHASATAASNPSPAEEFFRMSDPHAEDRDYFHMQLKLVDRSGFLWQKLREPRSYDYMKTKNKGYNERLRMPLFPLTDEQREAVMTFVLGLVAEPPNPKFVYHPDPQKKALHQGLALIEQLNCGGCHILEAERWDLQYHAGDFRDPPDTPDFPFVVSSVPEDQLTASQKQDPLRGTLRTTVHGLSAIDNQEGRIEIWDEEGDPLEEGETYDPMTLLRPFDLWRNAAIDGKVYQMGVANLEVPANTIQRWYPARGGDLTYLLLPRVVEIEKQSNPSANAKEAWAWLPPPLMGEGSKVQPEWLHNFLLEPYPIRPAVFLRMPKFNLSPTEAQRLVDYFTARDGYESPYQFHERTRVAHLQNAEREFAARHKSNKTRLDHAMQIVANANYCVKCHSVGDFMPEGSDRAKAPNLADVQFRLRPDYVRNWIANPKRILPYTNMPVNIPYNGADPHLGGVAQDIYPGTSIEQLDGLVDLLMNFSYYTAKKSKVDELVQSSLTQSAAPPAKPESNRGAESAPGPPAARVVAENPDDPSSGNAGKLPSATN